MLHCVYVCVRCKRIFRAPPCMARGHFMGPKGRWQCKTRICQCQASRRETQQTVGMHQRSNNKKSGDSIEIGIFFVAVAMPSPNSNNSNFLHTTPNGACTRTCSSNIATPTYQPDLIDPAYVDAILWRTGEVQTT